MTGQILDFNTAKRQGDTGQRQVDADDIRERLHADARAFVEWLFSGRAFINKNEARVGDVYGTPGASLSIHLSGPDAGLWKDHATDEGGDLIGLYRAFRGYRDNSNFVLSLKEIAKDFFNDPIEIERAPWQPTPVEYIAQKKAELGTKPRADLVELGAPVATYTYFDLRGNVIASVVRYEPDGTRASKTFRPYCHRTQEGVTKWVMGAPDLRPLYHLPEIATASEVVLCEGEGCADALIKLGIAATSAMQGAHAPIDKTDWSPLAGKKVVIWPDNDEPGFQYAKNVSERLAALGCQILGITPPAGSPAKWDAADCVAEGRDAQELIASATAIEVGASAADLYKLYTLEELENLPPPKWLIDGVMIENGLCLFWAGSDNYKTFVAIDMAMAVGTNTDWHGHSVSGGPVVYIAAEDLNGVAKRMIGYRETSGRDKPKANIVLLNDSFTVASPDADKLILSIKALPTAPRLIVIDTLARTFGAGNEDKTSDMGAFVDACDKIRRATGATVMVVHHTGRNTEQERGNVSLRGACDTIFTVQRVGSAGKIKLINTPPKGKQKNAEPFKDILLRMQQVHFDHHGTEQSTLIVMTDDTPAAGEPLKDEHDEPAQRLGQIEKSILSALAKAARGGREQLGFISLQAMVKGDERNVRRSLSSLVEKGLIEEVTDETDIKKKRRLYSLTLSNDSVK